MPFQKGNKLSKGGGRPKASHTLQAATAKAELIRMYMENVKPINEALLKKAKEGDMQAIKELHDRVWGKAPQDVQLVGEIKLKIDV